MENLALEWLQAKKAESEAVERRRKAEDAMVAALQINPDQEGSVKQDVGPWRVTVITRFNRKVDADLAQEIAAENGYGEHLGSLFRWKPEINAAAWKAANPEITRVLTRAITTTPARPSFSIEAKDA